MDSVDAPAERGLRSCCAPFEVCVSSSTKRHCVHALHGKWQPESVKPVRLSPSYFRFQEG
eukprot:scaffold83_cov246-Pinguiococcus_pyrenoidosus.AAC.6